MDDDVAEARARRDMQLKFLAKHLRSPALERIAKTPEGQLAHAIIEAIGPVIRELSDRITALERRR